MRLGITGHRGLLPKAEALVRTALDMEIRRHHPDTLVAVSCLADGPDAWFAEAALSAGARLEAVVPAEDHRAALPAEHQARYDALLRQAAEVHTTGFKEADPRAYMVGSEILVGLVDQLVAVWDGEPARGYGGTADVVAYAQRVAVPVRVVWPEGAERASLAV